MTEKMIDISNYQGKVSIETFKKIRKNGITGVILRSSYTSLSSFTLHEDLAFRNNIVNAYKAGLKIGIYHYSSAISVSEARKEAEYTINVISKYRSYITLPVFFDYEFGKRLSAKVAKGLGKTGCGKVCDAYCSYIKGKNFKTGVYANLNMFSNYLPVDIYKKWSIWLAQYPYGYKKVNDAPDSKMDYKHPVLMWQFTSSGTVPGLSGNIDMNKYYGNTPTPTPPTPKKYDGKFPILPKRGWFQKGDKGEQVKLLQRLLIWLGYSVGRAGIDGEYGSATAAAVLQYEKDYNLKYKDGEWGKECQTKAKTIMM